MKMWLVASEERYAVDGYVLFFRNIWLLPFTSNFLFPKTENRLKKYVCVRVLLIK